jgi:transcriptional regulator with PAS, ATPase and Fis domain
MKIPSHSHQTKINKDFEFESIIGNHPKILENLNLIAQIADTEATVIIYGESGTGKELVSRAIHKNSSRRNNPFVPLNCGAIPDTLLESELFGHVQGAFTGAIREKQGWFTYANGGTIFLDEIHEMSPSLQVKLLRVLQTGEYSLVGCTKFRKTNVRIVAATTRDLLDLIEKGKFRDELFYRINVIDITLPPLRERKSDIPFLTQHFLKIYCSKYQKEILCLSQDAKELISSYDYPGNVRELRNIIERIVILTKGKIINCGSFPKRVLSQHAPENTLNSNSPFKEAKRLTVEKFERGYIIQCLKLTKGNVTRAAGSAGIHITHFYSKMKQYNIDSYLFKR